MALGKRGNVRNVHVHPQSPGLLDVWKGCSYQMLTDAIRLRPCHGCQSKRSVQRILIAKTVKDHLSKPRTHYFRKSSAEQKRMDGPVRLTNISR